MSNTRTELTVETAGATVQSLIDISDRLEAKLKASRDIMLDIQSRTTSQFIKDCTAGFVDFFGNETSGAILLTQNILAVAAKIAEITGVIIEEDINTVVNTAG